MSGSSSRLRPRPPPDPTVLRPSIACSVTGLKQAIACLENGTAEIREYLLHECSLIYECKTCFSLFRSLANFVAHKRSYCDLRVKNVYHIRDEPTDQDQCSTVAYVEPEAIDTLVPEPHWDLQDYSPSLSLLKEAGFIEEIKQTPQVKKLKPDLHSIVHQLKRKAETSHAKHPAKIRVSKQDVVLKEPVLRLERISQTTCAMFQTVSDKKGIDKTMGQKYVEVEKLRQRPSVMAGPDGKIIYPDKQPKSDINRNNNNINNNNESVKENMSLKRRYLCPFCDQTYSKISTVIGHIQRVHGKTSKQAQDYRSSIRENSHLTEYSKDMECKHCHRSFFTIFGWRKHQRKCKSDDSRCSSENRESVVDILKNQPVIVLNKLDCSNLSYPNHDKLSEDNIESFTINKVSTSAISTSSKIKSNKNNILRYSISV